VNVFDSRITTEVKPDDELATLSIQDSVLSDGGQYKIVATNELGAIESACSVTVHSKSKPAISLFIIQWLLTRVRKVTNKTKLCVDLTP